ncbi:MAG: sugar kinase [Candidatus Latescibacterota bacterium]|nr:sugar kinase [Candidatus Latescibacterota bacterium]
MDIQCIGNLTADLFLTDGEEFELPIGPVTLLDDAQLHPGGTAANTGQDLARLGVPVVIHTRIGGDAAGDMLLNRMRASGAQVVAHRDTSAGTTLTLYRRHTDGHSSFAYFPGTSAVFSEEDVDLALLSSAHYVHVGGTFLLPSFDGEPCARLLQRARESGSITSLDPTPNITSESLEILSPCLPHLSVFLPNLEQAQQLSGYETTGDVAAFFLERGVDTVVLKMDRQGCYVRSHDVEMVVPAYRVEEVDSTGAGDAFVAGFLTGLHKGWDLKRSAELANAVGAMCVSCVGSVDGVGSLKSTTQFMKRRGS